MAAPKVEGGAPASREGLLRQVQGLDSRFWIVNIMEMFERLAYYGVRAVVAIYMVLPVESGGPGFSHIEKGAIFAAWASVQSVLPVFTGGVADRYGHKRTIAIAIALKIVGYVLMGSQMSYDGFFLGCIFLAAGTAVFKPGVQGTLATTLRSGNASVGWAIFYQLVNIGGFLGPVIAGILRNSFSWAWVFYACAFIVAVNYLWLPFYKDPTEEGDPDEALKEQAISLGVLSRAVSRPNAIIWLAISFVALLTSVWHFWGVWQQGEVLIEWMYVLWALLFTTALGLYLARKDAYDEGQSDLGSVFVVTVAGLFQPRVLWFCVLFAGFWLMFNQVFDLLPNVIEDWIDTAGILEVLGVAFTSPALVGLLSLVFALVMGFVATMGVMLSMRPDRRAASAVAAPPYVVVGLSFAGGALLLLSALVPGAGLPLLAGGALGIGAGAAGAARATRLEGRLVAAGAGLLAAAPAGWLAWRSLTDSAAGLTEMAAAGAQVNPEWMINMNPGLIVFTMVFFGYLTSFVRPLTSILIGMAIATAGTYVAGTATLGAACLAGIAIFSVGEMLSSPKKMEFLATLARKGQEGTFMGYANMPVAIGWILGSIGAGAWYEEHGDKKNLAIHYMETELGVSPDVLEAMPRSEVVGELAGRLGQSPMEVQRLLFELYHPERIWLLISAIGVASIVGMLIYAGVIRALERREQAA
ncbi:MAG: MFS family permease [Myxococcota bacterium]|jgi:MFS family permease